MSTKQALGKVTIVPKGAYDGSTTYQKLDVVTYNGSSYIALQETVGNLPTNTTYWELIAQKGDTGNTGATGARGATGEPGGSPIAVDSSDDMIDTTKVYVLTTDGHWYYYDGANWQDGGIYQASVNSNDTNYLLNRDDSSNKVNYDMLSNIYELSYYKNICQNSLIKIYESSSTGITIKHIGLNKINVSGTATASSINKISRKITLKANTTYTLAATDYAYYSVGDTMYMYLYEYGTSNSYKDSNNTTVSLQVNNSNKNVAKSFTTGNTDKDIEVGVYSGNGVSRNNDVRLYLIEGNYTINDIQGSTMLRETLNNRKFVGTATTSTVVPTFNTPVFYIAQGPGPFTNFGSPTTYTASDYFLIYNSMVNLNLWNVQVLPLMMKNTLNRQSIRPVSPSTNISLNPGERYWVIACEEGTYTNFIGYNGSPLTLSEGEVAIFNTNWDVSHTPNAWWEKEIIGNLASKTYIDNEINDALGGIASDIETYVYNWLDAHPEATTTVQDGAITILKLDNSLADKMNRIRLDSYYSSTWQDNSNDLNTIVGDRNMSNGTGSKNTAIGIETMFNASSEHSPNKEVAIGYHSLFRDWDGSFNVSIGNEAMDNLSHGAYNTALGSNALRVQRLNNYGGTSVEGETANRNTSIGGSAMYYTYGDNNTAVGYEALKGSTYGATGSSNVAIGAFAGKYNNSESNKLYVDDRDRGSRENENAKSLIVGTFNDDPSLQEVKINGKFGCNGATPQSSVTASPNASDLSSAITLLNQIKQVLIDNGIMK